MTAEQIPDGSQNPFAREKLSPEARRLLDDLFGQQKNDASIPKMLREEADEFGKAFKTAIAKEYPWDEDEVLVKFGTMVASQIITYYWYKKRLGAPRWAARGITGILIYAWLINERQKKIERLLEANA